MWQFSGALRPPSPLGSMLDLVLMVEFMRLTALKFSTLTRGGGGSWPIPHLHVKWKFDDAIIFHCVPRFEMDQKIFLIHELLSSKSHALAGSVSELSQNMRLTAFFKLYKICILLHRCNLEILAKKKGLKSLENSAILWKWREKQSLKSITFYKIPIKFATVR